MCKGMEVWSSFVSPRGLNIESLSYAGGRLNDLSPNLILVKTEVLDCLCPFSLQNMEDLGVLSFLILLNIEGHYGDVDGYSSSKHR